MFSLVITKVISTNSFKSLKDSDKNSFKLFNLIRFVIIKRRRRLSKTHVIDQCCLLNLDSPKKVARKDFLQVFTELNKIDIISVKHYLCKIFDIFKDFDIT